MSDLPRSVLVFSTLAVRGVFDALAASSSNPLAGADIIFSPTAVLLRRIAEGESADIGILTAEAVDGLIAAGTMVGPRTDLADSPIGLAVRAGAAHPPIGTLDGFVATLRAARSFCYSRVGASGIFFTGLLDRLGLTDELAAKALVVPSGFTAERVASGEVEFSIQQVSELMVVPGIDVVGPLPEGAQQISTFSAGVFAASVRRDAARASIAALADPGLAELYRANGLIPPVAQ